MSLGEDRVRIKFNPAAYTLVDKLKQKSAELIDICAAHKPANDAEVARLWTVAQTQYEDAAMWAVKAATAKLP